MSTRRAILAGLAGAATTTTARPASATVHPDAILIAIGAEAVPLLAEHDRHVAAYFALPAEHPDAERVANLADPAFERLRELVEQARMLKATTAEGYAAKALLLRHLLRMDHGNGLVFDAENATALALLARGLVDDLLRRAVA